MAAALGSLPGVLLETCEHKAHSSALKSNQAHPLLLIFHFDQFRKSWEP